MWLYYELLFVYLFDHKYCLNSIFFAIKMWDEQIDRKRDCLLVNRCVMEAAACFAVGVLHRNISLGWIEIPLKQKIAYFLIFIDDVCKTISQYSGCKSPVEQNGDRKWWSENWASIIRLYSSPRDSCHESSHINYWCSQTESVFCKKGCTMRAGEAEMSEKCLLELQKLSKL